MPPRCRDGCRVGLLVQSRYTDLAFDWRAAAVVTCVVSGCLWQEQYSRTCGVARVYCLNSLLSSCTWSCHVVSQSLSEMKQNFCHLSFNSYVLSNVYFCDVCLRVVGLPCAQQTDLWLLDFTVVLSIYTGMCFGICLYYFNIDRHRSIL